MVKKKEEKVFKKNFALAPFLVNFSGN